MAFDPYSSYPTKTVAPSAAYPLGSARDITVTGDRTGTPWKADVLNDIWGFLQSLLDHASLTADGNPDEVGASQYQQAVQNIAGSPGELVAWVGDGSPKLGVRLLYCTGQTVSIANYPELDTHCYTGDGSNATAEFFYRSSDAGGVTRSTTGGYLTLPDLRGRFIRGYDPAGTEDPDGASRRVPDSQDWALRKHSHYVWGEGANKLDENSMLGGTGCSGVTTQAVLWASGSESATEVVADNMPSSSHSYYSSYVPSANQDADEVRPVNTSVMWCLRY